MSFYEEEGQRGNEEYRIQAKDHAFICGMEEIRDAYLHVDLGTAARCCIHRF